MAQQLAPGFKKIVVLYRLGFRHYFCFLHKMANEERGSSIKLFVDVLLSYVGMTTLFQRVLIPEIGICKVAQ